MLCTGNLLTTLRDGGFTNLCGMDNIFLTTHDAVNFAYLKYHVSMQKYTRFLHHIKEENDWGC